MAFNLKSIKSVDQFEAQIKDPDGNPTGVFFMLAGPTHPVRKAMDQERSRKLINEANKTGKFKIPDPADAENSKPKDLARVTLGWRGYVDDIGQEVPFSAAAAEALYTEAERQWLVEQVEEALGNKQLFTKAVSTS